MEWIYRKIHILNSYINIQIHRYGFIVTYIDTRHTHRYPDSWLREGLLIELVCVIRRLKS